MTRYVRVPNYEDVRITDYGLALLAEIHDFDQGARSDSNGRRERVFLTSPATGQTARALVRAGLVRYALPAGSDYLFGVEATAAGCAVLAAWRQRP